MKELIDIRNHWNERATLGASAGTPDLIAKELEQRAILAACQDLPEPAFGLEIGCGTGETARLLTDRFPRLDLLAVDGAHMMIATAVSRPFPRSRLRFRVFDALELPGGLFDLILTQRMLINLPTWELQKQTIEAIATRLAPGGRFVMCENSQDGLDSINHTRHLLGLPAIQAPWHNRYIRDSEMVYEIGGMSLEDIRCYSASYYFLSRVVNAALAEEQGVAPDYAAPVNRLALRLTEAGVASRYAQGRVWIWEKRAQ